LFDKMQSGSIGWRQAPAMLKSKRSSRSGWELPATVTAAVENEKRRSDPFLQMWMMCPVLMI